MALYMYIYILVIIITNSNIAMKITYIQKYNKLHTENYNNNTVQHTCTEQNGLRMDYCIVHITITTTRVQHTWVKDWTQNGLLYTNLVGI